MKRMSPDRRKQIVNDLIVGFETTWTCKYGQWSMEKLLQDMEKALRIRRLGK